MAKVILEDESVLQKVDDSEAVKAYVRTFEDGSQFVLKFMKRDGKDSFYYTFEHPDGMGFFDQFDEAWKYFLEGAAFRDFNNCFPE